MSNYIPYHNHDLPAAFMYIKSCEYHNKCHICESHSTDMTVINENIYSISTVTATDIIKNNKYTFFFRIFVQLVSFIHSIG